MAEMATVLGNKNATQRYQSLADAATAEFHLLFFNTTARQYGGDLGAVQSLSLPALEIDSPPTPALREEVLQALEYDLAHRTNFTLRVGAVTAKILLNILSDNGLHETALRTAMGTQEPSWGHWWKAWNATTCYEAFPNNPFPSQQNEPHGIGTLNHIFLCGGIGHWMWKSLAGIIPAMPGFVNTTVMPRIHATLGPRGVSGDFLSPQGKISSSWRLDHGVVSFNVSLPVGVQAATLVVPKPPLPSSDDKRKPVARTVVTEHGRVVWDGEKLVGNHPGLESGTDGPEGVAFAASNGMYVFESERSSISFSASVPM